MMGFENGLWAASSVAAVSKSCGVRCLISFSYQTKVSLEICNAAAAHNWCFCNTPKMRKMK